MKKVILLSFIIVLWNGVGLVAGNKAGEDFDYFHINTETDSDCANFNINLGEKGNEIKNLVNNINVWNYHSTWLGNVPLQDTGYFSKSMPFVKYIQFMSATGGNEQRDLFVNPEDNSKKNDYDFSSLITACRNVLKQGLIPIIKTGSVPLKFSSKPEISESFGVNVKAPDSFDEYYDYIKALGDMLVKEFGKNEVSKWGWCVLTEFENKDWFKTGNDTTLTKINYFKLYDYTIDALQKAIDPGIYVGAHCMAVSKGFWDERDFIEHCVNGTNYKTGQKGARLCFLTCSFYDIEPGKFAKRSLPETISIVRDKAKQLGLDTLHYGIDEGRILSGSDGKPLFSRVVGQIYQAAYDARLYKIMLDNDIDYFSSWGYTSNGIWKGASTVSLFVADLFYKMVGSNRVIVKAADAPMKAASETDFFAGYNNEDKKLFIMGYNFRNSLDYIGTKKILLNIDPAGNYSGKVKITRWVVDDSSNFFNKWMKDYKTLGIKDDDFKWSKDSAVLDPVFFQDKKYSGIKSFENEYINDFKLKSSVIIKDIQDSKIKIADEIPGNGVIFYEIQSVH